ncbi:hypothetical protein KO516_01965 [Citreicella sp. C3M06]|uniref:hypothetical protein n=1 Tax=Citreicella sp. C3M06 TaxID=2841564 RepID=UPI001C092B39|nr:hypothetical protein [Citreicella sp. C3M06]MBU2959609.1 hypothetical protein [Citreicella sp. C3M06]
MRLLPLLIPVALAGCTAFPDLDRARTAETRWAPYPDLLPLEQLTDGPSPMVDAQMRVGLESRAEALRARAAGLSGPVVPAPVRSRMAQGVAWPYPE